MSEKSRKSKLKQLDYTDFEIQEYFKCMKTDTETKKVMFRFRTRMAKFGENYRAGGPMPLCPLCNIHFDTQALSFKCPVILCKTSVPGRIEDIYGNSITQDTVELIRKVTEIRREQAEKTSK